LLLERRSSRRKRALVILRLEIAFAHLLLEQFKVLQIVPGGLQNPARTKSHLQPAPDDVKHSSGCLNGGKDEGLVAAHFKQVAGQILHVQALGDNDQSSFLGIVEAGVDCRIEPVDRVLPCGGRMRFVCLERVVDDDVVGAAPGKCCSDRRCEPVTARSGADLGLVLLSRIEMGVGKDSSVKV